MLLILLAAVCVVLVSLGVMICRVAALSDESHRLAIAEWLATSRRGRAEEGALAERQHRLPLDGRGRFRATG